MMGEDGNDGMSGDRGEMGGTGDMVKITNKIIIG